MDWTKEQKDAIYKKDSNILVAAAAGSGKTAVLVERIIQKIINDNVDIDKLLVVTFTNAAASEMRERVLDAIYKKLEDEPDNENLQRQTILLGKSSICTIHSFCLDVIKNNFFEIPNLSANFRIGSEEEIELLKQEVLDDLFDKLYEEENEDFEKLINTYTGYKGDEPLKEIILKIYNFMQSNPFPEEWIEEKINMFKYEKIESFSDNIWGKILLESLREEIIDSINSLKILKNRLEKYFELDKYRLVIEDDISQLKELYDCTKNKWDEAYNYSLELKFKNWPTDRKITLEIKDEVKKSRDVVKKKIKDIIDNTLTYDSKSAIRDINEMYNILFILKNIILEFDSNFKSKKIEKNIIDFNDIEHYALKILIKKDENDIIPTDVAKRYQEKFVEIAIDEYQDSNRVQELILTSVSKGNNIFMVGDVKQSIYKFRQACPNLFLEKYDNYSLETPNEKGLKIQLFKNFRSKENVLNVTNEIFKNIMSKNLGDIDYTEEEYLNLGAEFEPNSNSLDKAELDIIDLKEEDSIWKEDNYEDDTEVDEVFKQLEKDEVEAKYVAKRIVELINSKVQVKDKRLGYRNIKYKDIVILLRSTEKLAPVYEKELLKNNIPVFSDSSNEYLDTMEIQTIMNVLRILDNPIDDISLVAVLRSVIGNFTDNEIVEIRLCDRNSDFYNSIKAASEKLEGPLKDKLNKFINQISTWRKESDYLSLAELIWRIYTETGFYNYVGLMTNGSLRQANLKALFERAKEYEKTSFKGLFNFIRFIERLKIGNSDMSSAKVISENEDVVRIMSIHKSKGLEFPIVFLSSSSKQFNLRDLSSDIILHEEYGLGPQYINYEKMIEYSTSAKDALKIVSKNESISEEMRILYVALTRAKEKLIITATVKDYQKDVNKKKDILEIYKKNTNTINPIILKKYISYYDWIQLVLLNSDKKDLINVNLYKKKDILKNEIELETEYREFNFDKETDFSKLEKEFDWKYKDELLTVLPVKSTVSKIKEIQNSDVSDFNALGNKEIGIAEIIPNFLKDEITTASRRGTLMHLFLQKIDFKKEYNLQELQELKNKLILKNMITEKESEYININKIYKFLTSELVKKFKSAQKIEQEKAFCIKMPAKDIFDKATDETILVQGIIDLFVITSNEKIVLLDYKTDYVENGEEEILIQKYKKQLSIYKMAIEKSLNKSVDEVYIYSLYLDKAIKVVI